MIYVKENKALLCKGDFHPAELYKGEKRITGFARTEFSGEGGVALESCYNDKLHNAQIIGNSVQDGTPTPDAPVEIQSVGEKVTEGDYAGKYKVSVKVRGKNLYKPTRLSAEAIRTSASVAKLTNAYGTVLSTTDAKIEEFTIIQSKIGNTSVPASYVNGMFVIETGSGFLKDGVSYTLSFDCEIIESPLNINTISISTNNADNWVTTKACNGRVSVNFRYNIATNGTDNYIEMRQSGQSLKISNIMITELGYNTDYEPYIEAFTTNIYLNEPLRKAGIYSDYIDFEKKKVIRNVFARTFKGTEYWQISGDNFMSYDLWPYDENGRDGAWENRNSIGAICNRFKAVSGMSLYYYGYNQTGYICCGLNSDGHSIGFLPSAPPPTVAEWKATLAQWHEEGIPLIIYHGVNEKEENIDLPVIPTFKGTTIYEIDTSVVAAISGNYKKVEGVKI